MAENATPKASQQPKVGATYAGGVAGAGLGGLIVYLWNLQVGPLSPLYLEPATAATAAGVLTSLLAGFTGPLLRRWQRWGEASDEGKAQQRETLLLLQEVLQRLEAQPLPPAERPPASPG